MNKLVEYILLTIGIFLVMGIVVSIVIGLGYVAFLLASLFLGTNMARGIGFAVGLLFLFSMGGSLAIMSEED